MLRWAAAGAAVAAAPVPSPPPARSCRRHRRLRPCRAKKAAGGGGVVLSKSVLLRSGVALFALGFVDAGYSGDWSRIGAISRETEELLKLAAYAVVPLSLALILSVPQDTNEKS
ncbi:hypothetical protein ACP4OV_015364 [Aristida adscensionis]